MTSLFQKKDYHYTALFCEENIWKLVDSLVKQGIHIGSLSILLLSNQHQHIVLFNQQASEPNESVIWDYHVILKYQTSAKTLIFDFDSRLDFPVDWQIYQQASFPNPQDLLDTYKMSIREISAQEYQQCFYSSRQHMQHLPSHSFPQYPNITPLNNKKAIHLSEYWNMNINDDIKGHSHLYLYQPN